MSETNTLDLTELSNEETSVKAEISDVPVEPEETVEEPVEEPVSVGDVEEPVSVGDV